MNDINVRERNPNLWSFGQDVDIRVVEPAIKGSLPHTVVGKVIEADEKANLCTVFCRTEDGPAREIKNVPVELGSDNRFFPRVGDKVKLRMLNGQPTITDEFITTFAEAKKKLERKRDIYADSAAMPVGGYILPGGLG